MASKNQFITYPIFKNHKSVIAFTTTKHTIVSTNHRFTGHNKSEYTANRKKLASVLNLAPQQLVFPRQTHSNCVAGLKQIPKKEISETDALITNKKEICLCIQTADCVPILLFDPEKNVIAAVHTGWRGTVAKIIENTLLKMKLDFSANPNHILAAIGPSISQEVYEVGPEVVEAAKQSIPNYQLTLFRNKNDRFYFNLWEANKQLLLKAGVQAQNINTLNRCSFLEADKFFSARRDGTDTGRMVSGIMLIDNK